MTRHLLRTAIALLLCAAAHAQSMLPFTWYQKYSYSDGAGFTSPETYFVDISDSGRICGYYKDAGGAMVGLLYFRNGTTVTYSYPGYTNTEFTGINDSVYVIGRAYTSPNSAVAIRGHVVDGQITDVVEMTWYATGNTSRQPKGLSIDNIAGGAYTAGSGKKWLSYYSITPPVVFSNADIYVEGSTQYNTFGQGVTKSGSNYLIPGYVLNGVTYHPFIYKHSNSEFDTFTRYIIGSSPRNTRLHDVNSNYYGAVMYQGTDGYWQGTVGHVGTFNDLEYDYNFPFQGALGSAVLGINEHNDIAGWTKDASNTIVAYYALCSENKIAGFDREINTFSVNNTAAVFDQEVDYATMDPYLGPGSPSLHATLVAANFPNVTQDELDFIQSGERSPHWTHFVMTTGEAYCYELVNGVKQPRADALKKWLDRSAILFAGYCYGMSAFAGQHYTNSTVLTTRFGNFSPDPDGVADYGPTEPYWNNIQSDVSALQLYQFSPGGQSGQQWGEHMDYLMNPASAGYNLAQGFDTMRYGIMRISESFGNPLANDALYILSGRLHNIQNDQYFQHAMLPFKVARYASTTVHVDTLYTYDPNTSGTTVRWVFDYDNHNIKGYLDDNTQKYESPYLIPGETLAQLDIPNEQLVLKQRGKDNVAARTFGGYHQVLTDGACEYTMVNAANAGQTFTNNSTGIINNFPGLYRSLRMDEDTIPDALIMNGPLHVTTTLTACGTDESWGYAYPDGEIGFARRAAQPGDQDVLTNDENFVKVENPSANSHDVALSVIITSGDGESLVSIDSLIVPSGDTATLTATDYQHFTLTNGGSAVRYYNLHVRHLAPDVLIERDLNAIALPGNANHYIIIQPEAGTENTKVIILTDLQQNGTIDDTTEVPNAGLAIGSSNLASGIRVTLRPNPAHDVLRIAAGNAAPNWQWRITDMLGRTLSAGTSNSAEATAPVSQLSPGLYLAEVRDARGTLLHRERFVKE